MQKSLSTETCYTQRERPIAIHSVLGEDVLLLKSIEGRERIGEVSEYRVEFLSLDPALDAAKLLGTPAMVRLSPKGVSPRVFRAFFADLERHEYRREQRLTRYTATLVPWIWFLRLGQDSRVFQGASAAMIAKQIIEASSSSAAVGYRFSEARVYSRRRFCVQYQESSLRFIQRLLEDDGIFFFVEDVGEWQQVVLCDSPSLCPAAEVGGPIHIREEFGRWDEEHIWGWRQRDEVRPTSFAANDYNFKAPGNRMLCNRLDAAPNSPVRSEVYEYPGGYMKATVGDSIVAERRLEELLTERRKFSAQTNCPALTAGRLFTVADHARFRPEDREYLVTGLEFRAENVDFDAVRVSSIHDAEGPVYQARVSAVNRRDEFRPTRKTPKPVMRGPQTATVVGRACDEVYTDRHARIRVRFHWDRYARGDERSSCWLRVSQAWAGKGFGWLALPRVGQEVIVDFLDGDPDRPIVTGRVYNGANMPPVSNAGREVTHKPIRGGTSGSGQVAAATPTPEPQRVEGARQTARPIDIDAVATPIAVSAAGVTSELKSALGGTSTGGDDLVSVQSYTPVVGLSKPEKARTPRPEAAFASLTDDWMHEDDEDESALPPGVGANVPMTTLKSDSLNGADGANEITINDSGASEGLFFNAQHNEVHVVGNDRIDQVGNNEMVSIGQNRVEDIGQNAQETVGVAKVIDVGTTLLIKAGTSITLQCGASTIHMNQAGFITISGTVINVAGAANCNMAAPITSVTGGLLMMTNGMLNMVNGGFLANMNSGGNAAVKAGGDALVQGTKVKLN